MKELIERLERLERLVEQQAKDAGLWFVAQTAAEAYLQQELRKLHAATEGKSPEECARATLKARAGKGE